MVGGSMASHPAPRTRPRREQQRRAIRYLEERRSFSSGGGPLPTFLTQETPMYCRSAGGSGSIVLYVHYTQAVIGRLSRRFG